MRLEDVLTKKLLMEFGARSDKAGRVAKEILNLLKDKEYITVSYIDPFIPVRGSENIAKMIGMSQRHYFRHVDELKKNGIVYIQRDGSHYRKVHFAIPYVLMKWRKKYGERMTEKYEQNKRRKLNIIGEEKNG